MHTDLHTIIQQLITSSLLIAILEFIRYRKKDHAEVRSTEKENMKITLENSIISSEANKKIMDNMRTKVKYLIDDINSEREDYRKKLREAKEEIDRLKKIENDLILENKELRQELHLKLE